MSKVKLEYPPGATPLDPDESAGLKLTYISTQNELNELESKNIAKAINWLHQKKNVDILNVSFILELHKQMFNDVWKWAGKQRVSNKNIGVSKELIMNQLGVLLQDTKFWIKNNTFPWDEIAARFHYRLVGIHIFSNGNGRHSRTITDLLLELNDQKSFSWGAKTASTPLELEGPVRKNYISALKAADQGDISLLLKFVHS